MTERIWYYHEPSARWHIGEYGVTPSAYHTLCGLELEYSLRHNEIVKKAVEKLPAEVGICCRHCIQQTELHKEDLDLPSDVQEHMLSQVGKAITKEEVLAVATTPPSVKTMAQLIKEECIGIAELLLAKNADYGNSAAEPIHVFSKASALEQVNVRIDDKLKRIRNLTNGHKANIEEDTERDLIGYLILKRCIRKLV